MTTVSGVTSTSSGWSNVTGGVYVHGRPSGLPAGAYSRRLVHAGYQRLAQRDVELHGSRVGTARTLGRHQYSARRGAPLGVERGHRLGGALGQSEADGGADLGAEVAELFHRLVGARAEEVVGPVGTQHDQRHAGVVGLHHRGAEVGDRGARGHRHAHRRAGRRPTRSPGTRRCARRCARAAAAVRRGPRRAGRTPAERCANQDTARRLGRRRGSIRRRRCVPGSSTGSL